MTPKAPTMKERASLGGIARSNSLTIKQIERIATKASQAAAKARSQNAKQRHKLLAGGGWRYIGGRWEDPASKGLFTMKAALQMLEQRTGKRQPKA